MKGLAALIHDIMNGEVFTDELSRHLLLGCILVPIAKADGGVRPIAMGELFYKIAVTVAMESIDPKQLQRIFAKIQCGVFKSGGADRAVQCINMLMQCYDRDNMAVLKTDISNAFNSAFRCAIVKALEAHEETKPIWRLFEYSYRDATPLLIYDYDKCGELVATLRSEEGVRQGDCCFTFLFTLLVQPIYERAVKRPLGLPDTALGNAVADHDDFTLVCTLNYVVPALQRLEIDLAAVGLMLQMSKTEILIHESVSDSVVQRIIRGCTHTIRVWNAESQCTRPKVVSIQVKRHFLDGCLGTRIAFNPQHITDYTTQAVDQHALFFVRLQHAAMPVQIAYQLLRYSGIPRLNYLMRVT